MSALEEKLEHRQSARDNVARATLEQLRQRWGYSPADDQGVIYVMTMSHVEKWVLESGSGLKSIWRQVR